MDRNSLIGIVLIGLIVVTFNYLNRPSEQEIQRQQEIKDSIALVKAAEREIENTTEQFTPSAVEETVAPILSDSLQQEQLVNEFGSFANNTSGIEKEFKVTTDLFTLTFSNLGGQLKKVTLNDFVTYDSIPIELFNEESIWNVSFAAEKRNLSTNELYFQTNHEDVVLSGDESKTISFKAETSPGKYLAQEYTIKGNSYFIDYDLIFNGLDNILERDPNLQLDWSNQAQQQELNLKYEKTQTCLLYHSTGGGLEHLKGSSKTKEEIISTVKFDWVAFKNQFFNASVINRAGFTSGTVKLTNSEAIKVEGKDKEQLVPNAFEARLPLEYQEDAAIPLQLYFGPNDERILKTAGLDMEEIIPYGWGIFGYVNKWLIVPVFHFLSKFIPNYGIIIFILAVLVKLILSPLTYKSYLSTAKMKVLKPELAELKEKYGKDAARMQQEQMKLYSKAGVNPMGGCLPMMLQMPILFAMYRFFPSSIDLRQAGFLWANDLSTYDNIYNLPFNIPFYGDHISLFTLLMTLTSFFTMKANSQMQPGMASGPAASQMKMMQYFMPIMFLGIFNNFAAGLTYYYLLYNIFTYVQQKIINRYFIDEDAIHAQIQQNKKKPKKKSGFQARLQKMMEEQERAKKQRKR